MTNSKSIVENTLKSFADKSAAAHSARFFKTAKGEYGEGDLFLGVRVPVIRKQVKLFENLPLNEVSGIIRSPYHEIRLFSVLLLVHKYKKNDNKEKIYQFYLKNLKYINNWDIVDSSASYIVGDYLYEKDKSRLYTLVKSKNLWHRRVAVISTFDFIRKARYTDSLKIAKILLEDKEDLIHKAVGWMLREIGNRDMSVATEFLNKHYRNMPRTMLRYAIEKFPEKRRKAYLHGHV